ncbi:MAG TPA: SEC-C metal-binding domain-containing protein [Polyangiaceae bacterium]|nr:SEC-C metal-binding domain-containing protein [Polyangiaceae bacterium]
MGAAAVPPLIALLEDDDAAAEDAPGEGWPPIHAVDLLADLRAEEAIGPMLRALRGGDMDDILSSRIAVRLPVFGAAALEPVLAELSGSRNANRAVMICAILANLRVKEERVWLALSACFNKMPSLSAGILASYGDSRALPLIERQIFAFDGESPSSLAHFDLELLVEAYEELAGEMPEQLAARVDYLFERQSSPVALTDSPLRAVSAKVGRNEPCPCGSGKKHKRCCLA